MSARTLPEATFARTVLGSGPGLTHGAGSSIDLSWRVATARCCFRRVRVTEGRSLPCR